jgi:hypothetical protein
MDTTSTSTLDSENNRISINGTETDEKQLLTKIIENAKATLAEAAETQKAATAACAEAQSKLAEITGIATQALAAKTQISDEQAVIAAKSTHIQGAQEYADKIRAELDRTLTAATKQLTETEAHKVKAQASAVKAEELTAGAREFKVSVETQGAAIAESVRMAGESQRGMLTTLNDAQAKLAEVTTAVSTALAAKTQITDVQAIIATKSDHIQKAQEHADKVRADLDRAFTAATQQVTAAEAQKATAESAAKTSTDLANGIQTIKGAIENDATAIAGARKIAEESTVRTKDLAEQATVIETRIADYQKRLAELDVQSAAQLKTITDLLPGATAAGLAHAFDKRRETFKKPSARWQWVFVTSVLAVVGLTISGLWHVFKAGVPPSYDELIRLWLSRLPVMAALVWLALHASRESALAKRLEEDYGYKAAISSCFEGFKKQMSEVGTGVPSGSALAKLLTDTLNTIASPPGRIYDRHQLAVSPADELKVAAKAAADVVSAVKK